MEMFDERTEINSNNDKELVVSGLSNEECRTLINLLQKTSVQKSESVADQQSA